MLVLSPPIRTDVPSRFSHVQRFPTLLTVAHQAHVSIEFSRHEYCSVMMSPSPGDVPNTGIKPVSLKSICIGRWLPYHYNKYSYHYCQFPLPEEYIEKHPEEIM